MSEPSVRRHQPLRLRCRGLLFAALSAAAALPAVAAVPAWTACRLPAVETEARCTTLQRPLDPTRPSGTSIELHVAVLPALSPQPRPDPVFFLAGGPGQSAIELAGGIARLLGRIGNRRDIVLVDQRGTGRSAPLKCDDESPLRPLREQVDPQAQRSALRACRERLAALPHGDLKQYVTSIAVQDLEAVRQRLGAPSINLVGVSYGTRVALEYQRQFPRQVRRVVLDGVAPPDLVLPEASSADNQAALDALWASCESDPACRQRFPALRAAWQRLLAGLPREAVVAHPVTGASETLVFTRAMVLSLVRQPLYVPALASALPWAVSEAADGRFGALVGLGSALQGGRRGQGIAAGMHFSVVCAEDVPRPGAGRLPEAAGADFGDSFAELYRPVCADWPRGEVPAGFYTIPPAPAAALLLSGAIDPVTPPRHAERVARALGDKARHVVVPHAGHGVMSIGCVRDVVFRFIDAADDGAAAKVDAGCAAAIPRPPAFVPPMLPTAKVPG